MFFCKQKIVQRAIEPINIRPNMKWVIETPICFLLCFFSPLFIAKKTTYRFVDLVLWPYGRTCARGNQRHQQNERECVWACVSRGCECECGPIWHLIAVAASAATQETRARVKHSHAKSAHSFVSRSADAVRRLIVGAWLFSFKILSTRVGYSVRGKIR